MSDPATPSLPLFVCPFCGGKTPDQARCAACNGPLDPLSRQATQNSMGPWFIRDEQQPFRPGCSHETVVAMISRGRVTLDTIMRGPTTAQFWYPARRVPGVAHRLGVCHSCQAVVASGGDEIACPRCGAEFHAEPDRQFLGLMPVRLLPGQGPGQVMAEPPAELPMRASSETVSLEANSVPRRSAMAGRMEGEIASLRKRVSVLIGVAAACAVIALVAIGLSLSRPSGATGSSLNAPGLNGSPSSLSSSGSGADGARPNPRPSQERSSQGRPVPAKAAEKKTEAGPVSPGESQAAPGTAEPNSGESKEVPKREEGTESPEKEADVASAKAAGQLGVLRSIRWP